MEGISDIKICGIDEMRPPKILSSPYIDLFFKLTHEAPKAWCDDFNSLGGKREYKAKIDAKVGLFIETWVRKPAEVEKAFMAMKEMVDTCTADYIARARAKAGIKEDKGPAIVLSPEQVELNRIIAGLDYDLPEAGEPEARERVSLT